MGADGGRTRQTLRSLYSRDRRYNEALNNCLFKYGSGLLAARITLAAPCSPEFFSCPLPSSDLVAPRLQLFPFIPSRRSNRPNPPARQNPSPRSRASLPGAQAAAIAARRIGGAYGVASASVARDLSRGDLVTCGRRRGWGGGGGPRGSARRR